MISLAQAAKDAAIATRRTRSFLVLSYHATLYDIGESLVFFTPYKTGLASSNWNVGTAPISTERKVTEGIKGQASLNAMLSQVQHISMGTSAIFSNPIDYIDKLESGTSRQAPAGMVTPTRVRIDDIWIKNLKEFNII